MNAILLTTALNMKSAKIPLALITVSVTKGLREWKLYVKVMCSSLNISIIIIKI